MRYSVTAMSIRRLGISLIAVTHQNAWCVTCVTCVTLYLKAFSHLDRELVRNRYVTRQKFLRLSMEKVGEGNR